MATAKSKLLLYSPPDVLFLAQAIGKARYPRTPNNELAANVGISLYEMISG
jgi:hypothetical protein